MKFYLLFAILYLPFTSFTQDSTNTKNLDEVTVTANFQETEIRKTARNIAIITAKDIERAPVKTLDGILQYALNVDVRSRGPLGVQSDISIRGGNYDQTLIMLDGVKLNDPQTGHHSLNLPITLDQIERIEVLQGGGSRIYGPAAFAGVINIITKKNQLSQLNLGYTLGDFGLKKLNLGANIRIKKLFTTFGIENIKSDGYAKNTAFDRHNLFANLSYNVAKYTQLNVQAGIFSNIFGASNFYSPTKYDQYEDVFSGIALAQIKQSFSVNFSSSLTGSYRKHNDMYDFDNYRFNNKYTSINFHKTAVYDLNWAIKLISNLGTTSMGVEYREENVISNRLGDILKNPEIIDYSFPKYYEILYYNKGKTRQNTSAYFEQFKQFEKATLTFGSLLNFNTQFGTNWYPGIDFSYAISQRISIYSSINRSLRFPTFTEMYLTGATVKGDPNLKPEDAWTYEIGLKHKIKAVQWTTALFYKHSNSAIDKVKRPENSVPTMENIGNMNTRGFEFSTFININTLTQKENSFLQNIKFNLALLNVDKKEAGYQSFYTLNYLKQKASFGVNWRLAKNLSLDTWYTYKARAGQYQWDAKTAPVNYAPVNLLDARVNFTQKYFRFFVDGTNLLNKKYYEYGFVEQPGSWLSGGIWINIK
jgi:vitamin B12 transporter